MRAKQIFDSARQRVASLCRKRSESQYYRLAPLSQNHIDKIQNQKTDIIFIVIAFNDAELVRLQHESLQSNLKESFLYIVGDNSNNESASLEIKKYCQKKKIPHIKLPKNPYSQSDPSASHGLALNYCYYNFLQNITSSALFFIDHDIFLFKPYSVLDKVKHQPIYGLVQQRDTGWYLWPGFTVFRQSIIQQYQNKINFMPVNGLDTGGGNYQSIYLGLNLDKLQGAREERQIISDATDDRDTVSILDGAWLHLRNGSGWAGETHFADKLRYYSKRLRSKK